MPKKHPLISSPLRKDALAIADVKVGDTYMTSFGTIDYEIEVKLRTQTHTFIKHAHGDTAIPNNMPIDLISFYKDDTIKKS